VELLDPQGHNRKCRPAVIVSPDADIQADGEVWVVAISSRLDAAPAEDQVELPWDRRGHPRTGLKERCAAICTWMEQVSVASIQDSAGIVPGRQLSRHSGSHQATRATGTRMTSPTRILVLPCLHPPGGSRQ
jgi:mRNA-degrading endonuclease toxin of MazEF toxin-antitoxin module